MSTSIFLAMWRAAVFSFPKFLHSLLGYFNKYDYGYVHVLMKWFPSKKCIDEVVVVLPIFRRK
jgi:hypothetical protein